MLLSSDQGGRGKCIFIQIDEAVSISVYLPIEIKEEQGLGLDILLSGQRDSVQILTSSSSDT